MAIHSVYLNTIFNPEVFPRTVNKTIEAAKSLKEKYQFDTLVFCGISGAAMAFILARELNMPMACVRKMDDGSHFNRSSPDKRVEGFLNIKKYLIVDDFISSGATVSHIVRSIDKEVQGAKCVAMLMYSTYENYNTELPDGTTVEVVSSRPEDSSP